MPRCRWPESAQWAFQQLFTYWWRHGYYVHISYSLLRIDATKGINKTYWNLKFFRLNSKNTQNNSDVWRFFSIATLHNRWRNWWIPHTAFSKMSQQEGTVLTELCLFPFTIVWPQMGWKSQLQRESIQVCPMLQQYVDTVHRKKLSNPATASFDTAEAAQQDLFILAKLEFSVAVCWSFSPLLV